MNIEFMKTRADDLVLFWQTQKLEVRKATLGMLYLLGVLSCLSPEIVNADLPDAPIILEATAGGCSPVSEVCGDGIDQDCDGSDLPCSGSDRDMDGYATGSDCDDSNRKVYPGISIACSAACGAGTQTCQSGGSFSACSCTPLCEATGTGRCFYVSKLTGSDSNPGTFAAPFRTLLPITDYYCPYGADGSCPGTKAPANKVELRAGDAVYLMSGVYDDVIDYQGVATSFVVYNRNGTSANKIQIKAYPGASPVISPKTNAFAMYMMLFDWGVIEGIEFYKAYGAGLRIVDSTDNLELRNIWVHDTDGEDNNNVSGISVLAASNLNLHHSMINDNYDRTCADTGGVKTENSRNIVLYAGGNQRIHHNVIFQTPPTTAPKTGACLVYKHGMEIPGATFEVDHNIFQNCFFNAIGTITYGGRFHHNLILNSESAFNLKNHGHIPVLSDNIIEYNTIVNTPGFTYRPTEVYEVGGSFGSNTFRRNLIVDNTYYYANVGGILQIDPYGSNTAYSAVSAPGMLNADYNCYHNTAYSVVFGYFSVNNTSDISLGGLYDFTAWKGRGYDTHSVVANPSLNQLFSPQNSSCSGMGHYVGW